MTKTFDGQEARGISVDVDAGKGTITIVAPITEPLQSSASGKSLIVASSHGNIDTNALYQGKNIILGFNAYIRKDKK